MAKVLTRAKTYQHGSDENFEKPLDELKFIREFYQVIGSREDNKTIELPVEIKNTIDRFLVDFNEYSISGVATQGLKDFDEYLSALNYDDNVYPYEDFYQSSQWFGDLTPYSAIKNIVHVSYNIVHGSNNIVHNTEG